MNTRLRHARHGPIEVTAEMAWLEHACIDCGARIASMTLMAGATPYSELSADYQPKPPQHGLPAYGHRRRKLIHRGRTPVRRGAFQPGPDGEWFRLPLRGTTTIVQEPAFYVWCTNCDAGQVITPPTDTSIKWYRGPRREVSAKDFMLPM